MSRAYTPRRGDIVWIDMDPQAGHEQAGRRPALVVSPESYNRKVGLALVCPVTSRIKGYPFEVLIPDNARIGGAILSDQVKSVDWKARRAEFCHAVPPETIDEARMKIGALLKD